MACALRQLLAKRGLSVTELSRRSSALYASSSPYHVPHNLLHLIEAHGLSPHMCQLVALSTIALVPLVECLQAAGVNLRRLWVMQAYLHANRTTVIPDARYAAHLQLIADVSSAWSTCPADTMRLSAVVGRRFELMATQVRASRFRYGRLGLTDNGSAPALMPGSLVRVNIACRDPTLTGEVDLSTAPLHLVDCGAGLMCRHVIRLDAHRVLLVAQNPECEPLECRVPADIILVGRVDRELRWLTDIPDVLDPSHFPTRARPHSRPSGASASSLGAALRAARNRLGLHLRDLHRLTRVVAAQCGSDRYTVALGSLSDYETTGTLPRHIEKIFSLACVYNMDFFELLALGGVQYDREALERDAMAPHHVKRVTPRLRRGDEEPVEPVFPEYLTPYLPLGAITPGEVYLVGQSLAIRHPALTSALALIISRRCTVSTGHRNNGIERPLYLFQSRSGQYLCGRCIQKGENITIVPHPAIAAPAYRAPRRDLDVIGVVTGVLRHI